MATTDHSAPYGRPGHHSSRAEAPAPRAGAAGWQAEPRRRAVRDASGLVVADFVRMSGTGDGADFWWADSLRPRIPDLVHAAQVVGHVLAGWTVDARVAPGETAFLDLLLRSAEAHGRHAHHYLWDFTRQPADPGWREPWLPVGFLLVAPREVGNRRLFRLHQRAYPPGHPDFPAGDPSAFASVVDGSCFGRLLDGSAVALAPDGRPVAAVLVAEHSGDHGADGPGVVDIFRDPRLAPPGLGALLLRRAVARAEDAGLPLLRLAVTEGNPARRVYERTGFVHCASSRTVRLPLSQRPAL